MRRTFAVGLLCGLVSSCGPALPQPPPVFDAGVPVDAGSPVDAGEVGRGSKGCGRAAVAGAQDLSVEVGAATRRAVLVVPAGYRPEHPHPLFIGLHASGGTAESGRAKLMLESGAPEAALYVYPNGSPGASPTGTRGWSLDPSGPDVALFDALLATLEDSLCIDLDRVVVAGFSNGAQLANVLGCVRASKLRMISSVAGTPGPTTCGSERVAALLVAGEADGIVDLAVAHQARDAMLARNGCASTTQPRPAAPCPPATTCSCWSGEGCLPGLPVTACQHSGGHDYPPFVQAELWRMFSSLGRKP